MSHRSSTKSAAASTKEGAKIQRQRQTGYVQNTSNNSLRPTITAKPTLCTSKPTTTNPAKPDGLADRSATSSTTCTSSSSSSSSNTSSDADSSRSSHRSAGSSGGTGSSTCIDKSKARRDLHDLINAKDEEIAFLKAQLASVEFENTKLASENMTLRQDKAVMEEKLRDATEQIRQHEAMADDFIKDVARMTQDLKEAKAEACEQRAKVETMQGKLHKVVEDGSAFIQGLANQLNTTEEQLEKVRSEYNAIKLGVYGQAEKQHHHARHTRRSPSTSAEHATNGTNDIDSKLQKDNIHRHHRHRHRHRQQPWPRLTLDDGAESKELLTSILDIAAEQKFQELVVKPPSPIDSRSSSTTEHRRRETDTPPLKEIEIITSKLAPPIQEEQKKHHKRHKQVKVERAGRAA